jgi:hypothetical protein
MGPPINASINGIPGRPIHQQSQPGSDGTYGVGRPRRVGISPRKVCGANTDTKGCEANSIMIGGLDENAAIRLESRYRKIDVYLS